MCPVGNGNGGRGSLGNILDKFTRGSGRKLNVESILDKFTLCFGADHFDFLKYFGLECVRKKLPQATVRFPFVLGGYMRARKSSRALTFINIIFLLSQDSNHIKECSYYLFHLKKARRR